MQTEKIWSLVLMEKKKRKSFCTHTFLNLMRKFQNELQIIDLKGGLNKFNSMIKEINFQTIKNNLLC